MDLKTLHKINDFVWEIPMTGEMRVPGRIFASEKLVQEMDEKVMRSHIDLYVNTFSLDLAPEGLLAVRRLFAEAEARGIFPSSDKPLLAEEV